MEELVKMLDYSTQVIFKRQMFLDAVAQDRLAAQLPRGDGQVRRELALACYRLAHWLDAGQYVQQPETVREYWARGSVTA
jgi:hypothetical protein